MSAPTPAQDGDGFGRRNLDLRSAAERVLKEARLRTVAFSVPTTAMAALSAALSTEPASVWQDFGSAPRDGTRFLATGGGLGNVIDFVNYSERVGCWNASECTLDDRDDEPDGYSRPTHWMPLPPPPVGSGRNLADATPNKGPSHV